MSRVGNELTLHPSQISPNAFINFLQIFEMDLLNFVKISKHYIRSFMDMPTSRVRNRGKWEYDGFI